MSEIDIGVNALATKQWQMQGIHFSMGHLQQPVNALQLNIARLKLPKPLENWQLLNIVCTDFVWQNQQIACNQGTATVKFNNRVLKSQSLHFRINENQAELVILGLALAKGRVNLEASEHQGHWQIELLGNNLALTELQQAFSLPVNKIKKGYADLNLTLTGQQQVANAALTVKLVNTSGQAGQNRYALENASLELYLNAQPQAESWSWQSHLALTKGALYIDPVYLAVPSQPIEFDSVGVWSPVSNRWQIDYAQYLHPAVATLQGYGVFEPNQQSWLKAAQLQLKAIDLKQVTSLYNAPFWVGTGVEGLSLTGNLLAKSEFINQTLTSAYLETDQIALLDTKQRFGLQNGSIHFNWSSAADFKQDAQIAWQQCNLFALPLGAAKFNLAVNNQSIALNKSLQIHVLGGELAIAHFAWFAQRGEAPELHFAGTVNALSLAQLTKALDWPPLSGRISGEIPGLNYHNNRLDLEGLLKVQLFAGEVTFEKLAVANLLSNTPKFYSDIEINNIDLNQLSDKFKFGNIKGLLSGFVRDLYLENWRPVSFYAWLGTPEHDNSTHRISQKAVDNIANIGGNGATDLISRGVLGVFDSFGYDKLGFGCYLHQGVCQLMGVAPYQNGYYLVKGGGLPRIDVIGYNPQVDWQVLLQRLERVGQPNDMQVE